MDPMDILRSDSSPVNSPANSESMIPTQYSHVPSSINLNCKDESLPWSLPSQEVYMMRETHKYIFFGPYKKDIKNTYFGAVHLYEKKLRLQAGQKITLHHGKEVYGVALVGQAQNRQVWVWLVSFNTEDVMKRLVAQVADVVGVQTPEEQDICRNALHRYMKKSSSYRTLAGVSPQGSPIAQGHILLQGQDLSPESSPSLDRKAPRRLRSHERPQELKNNKRVRRYNRRTYESDYEDDDDLFEDDLLEESEDDEEICQKFPSNKRQMTPQALDKHRVQHGELFMTLLECVVMTLEREYPERA